MKDEMKVKCSSALYAVTLSATKDLVNMTKESGITVIRKTEGDGSSLKE